MKCNGTLTKNSPGHCTILLASTLPHAFSLRHANTGVSWSKVDIGALQNPALRSKTPFTHFLPNVPHPGEHAVAPFSAYSPGAHCSHLENVLSGIVPVSHTVQFTDPKAATRWYVWFADGASLLHISHSCEFSSSERTLCVPAPHGAQLTAAGPRIHPDSHCTQAVAVTLTPVTLSRGQRVQFGSPGIEEKYPSPQSVQLVPEPNSAWPWRPALHFSHDEPPTLRSPAGQLCFGRSMQVPLSEFGI